MENKQPEKLEYDHLDLLYYDESETLPSYASSSGRMPYSCTIDKVPSSVRLRDFKEALAKENYKYKTNETFYKYFFQTSVEFDGYVGYNKKIYERKYNPP